LNPDEGDNPKPVLALIQESTSLSGSLDNDAVLPIVSPDDGSLDNDAVLLSASSDNGGALI